MTKQNKNITKWIETHQGKHLCQCGCGKPIKITKWHYHRSKTIPNYIKGHIFRNHVNRPDNSKHSFKKDMFKIPLNPTSTYIFGFIMADGCIYKTRKGHLYLDINLNKKDIDILNKIKREICPEIPIYQHEENKARLRIHNKNICNDLISLGVVFRKSLILRFPHFLNKDLFPHFLRGYFDGDGNIEWCTKNTAQPYFRITITSGTKSFKEKIKIKLKKDYKIRSENLASKYSIRISGDEAFKLRDVMYNGAKIYLNRKKEDIFKQKERLLRTKELSKILKISRDSIRRWRIKYSLPYTVLSQKRKFPLFSLNDLNIWRIFISNHYGRRINNGKTIRKYA